MLHENTLKNGEKRVDLVELTVDDVHPYADKLNSPVSVPVSVSVWPWPPNLRLFPLWERQPLKAVRRFLVLIVTTQLAKVSLWISLFGTLCYAC